MKKSRITLIALVVLVVLLALPTVLAAAPEPAGGTLIPPIFENTVASLIGLLGQAIWRKILIWVLMFSIIYGVTRSSLSKTLFKTEDGNGVQKGAMTTFAWAFTTIAVVAIPDSIIEGIFALFRGLVIFLLMGGTILTILYFTYKKADDGKEKSPIVHIVRFLMFVFLIGFVNSSAFDFINMFLVSTDSVVFRSGLQLFDLILFVMMWVEFFRSFKLIGHGKTPPTASYEYGGGIGKFQKNTGKILGDINNLFDEPWIPKDPNAVEPEKKPIKGIKNWGKGLKDGVKRRWNGDENPEDDKSINIENVDEENPTEVAEAITEVVDKTKKDLDDLGKKVEEAKEKAKTTEKVLSDEEKLKGHVDDLKKLVAGTEEAVLNINDLYKENDHSLTSIIRLLQQALRTDWSKKSSERMNTSIAKLSSTRKNFRDQKPLMDSYSKLLMKIKQDFDGSKVENVDLKNAIDSYKKIHALLNEFGNNLTKNTVSLFKEVTQLSELVPQLLELGEAMDNMALKVKPLYKIRKKLKDEYEKVQGNPDAQEEVLNRLLELNAKMLNEFNVILATPAFDGDLKKKYMNLKTRLEKESNEIKFAIIPNLKKKVEDDSKKKEEQILDNNKINSENEKVKDRLKVIEEAAPELKKEVTKLLTLTEKKFLTHNKERAQRMALMEGHNRLRLKLLDQFEKQATLIKNIKANYQESLELKNVTVKSVLKDIRTTESPEKLNQIISNYIIKCTENLKKLQENTTSNKSEEQKLLRTKMYYKAILEDFKKLLEVNKEILKLQSVL